MQHSIPTTKNDLSTWLDYWQNIHSTGIDLGLERVQPVAEYLAITKPNAKVITVAGTNGKGSTTTTISSILQAQGYKVGLYQSPHIYRFNERVKINGIEVDDATLIDAFVAVEQARQACNLSLSFFEATTLAGLYIFQQQQCDVWVLEVGLGGRLDVVNVIDADVAVITNIGLDHVDWLGDTIEKIAYEKAGIIRANIPVVFASTQTVPQAILDKVAECQASLYALNQDYFYQCDDDAWSYASPAITLRLPYGTLAVENMAGAISAVLLSGLNITVDAIRQGVIQAKLAGRFDVRHIDNKTVIFDAGHNPHGIEFLIEQIRQYQHQNPHYREVNVVFSMLNDKDIQGVVERLSPMVSHWYVASLNNYRATSLEQLKHYLPLENINCYNDIKHAFATAFSQLQQHQLLLVCGSFYTLEAVWECLNHE